MDPTLTRRPARPASPRRWNGSPRRRRRGRPRRGADAFVWHPGRPRLAPVPAGLPRRHRPAAGRRPAEATSCWRTRCASPAGCRPTTPCCGARAAWASPRWSRRPMPRRMRADPGPPGADRDPPRGHPHAARAAERAARPERRRCLIFCDDLSFEKEDADYKALKSVLDGGIEGRPDNVLFYATSNRRHLMPRDMIENERSTAINPSEAIEEKVSLSDRFGLWIGFHNCDQDDLLRDDRRLRRQHRRCRSRRTSCTPRRSNGR